MSNKNTRLKSMGIMERSLNWTESELLEDEHNKEIMMSKMKTTILKERKRFMKSQLKQVKKSYRKRERIKKRKKIQTTKLAMCFIFVNCIVVEIYSMATMLILRDLSSLSGLITAVITQAISFAIYSVKSFKETKEEEDNKLRRENLNSTLSSNIEGYHDEEDVEEEEEENIDIDFNDSIVTNNPDS